MQQQKKKLHHVFRKMFFICIHLPIMPVNASLKTACHGCYFHYCRLHKHSRARVWLGTLVIIPNSQTIYANLTNKIIGSVNRATSSSSSGIRLRLSHPIQRDEHRWRPTELARKFPLVLTMSSLFNFILGDKLSSQTRTPGKHTCHNDRASEG